MTHRLTLLVHGTPKIGKSWLGESCPGPVLVLDGEGSTDFLHRKRRTRWMPGSAPPTAFEDGSPLGINDLGIPEPPLKPRAIGSLFVPCLSRLLDLVR